MRRESVIEDLRFTQERLVRGHQNPIREVQAILLVTVGVHRHGVEPGIFGDRGDYRFQIDVLVGYVEDENSIGLQILGDRAPAPPGLTDALGWHPRKTHR